MITKPYAVYEQVRRMLEAPARPQPAGGTPNEFKALISSVSPDTRQPVGIPTISDQKAGPAVGQPVAKEPDHGPMASLRLNSGGLYPPAPPGPLPSIAEPEIQNQEHPSVKTPTLIEARRTPSMSGVTEMQLEERMSAVAKLVQGAAKKHGVDPSLSMAVVSAESSFNPYAVSVDGHESKGLFQLLDSTGKHLLEKSGRQDKYDPFNPELNTDLGVSYLRYLHDIFNSSTKLPNGLKTIAAANASELENFAVAAFNAGEGRVASAQERANRAGKDPSVFASVREYLPEITERYVGSVSAMKRAFTGGDLELAEQRSEERAEAND